jgi:hypothetical protein
MPDNAFICLLGSDRLHLSFFEPGLAAVILADYNASNAFSFQALAFCVAVMRTRNLIS